MRTTKSKPLVIVLERAEVDEEGATELQVAAILGGAPADKKNEMSDAQWLHMFIEDCGLENALFNDDVPAAVAKEEVFVIVGCMVSECFETDYGTDYDQSFEIDKIMTEQQALLALGVGA